ESLIGKMDDRIHLHHLFSFIGDLTADPAHAYRGSSLPDDLRDPRQRAIFSLQAFESIPRRIGHVRARLYGHDRILPKTVIGIQHVADLPADHQRDNDKDERDRELEYHEA